MKQLESNSMAAHFTLGRNTGEAQGLFLESIIPRPTGRNSTDTKTPAQAQKEDRLPPAPPDFPTSEEAWEHPWSLHWGL